MKKICEKKNVVENFRHTFHGVWHGGHGINYYRFFHNSFMHELDEDIKSKSHSRNKKKKN